MTKTITQKVVFKNTSPKALYELYMDAKKHSKSTGAIAKITDKETTNFTAYDNYISGKNLHLIKDKLIVQSWRGSDWTKGDMDSTFIMNFESKGNDTILQVTHANLPVKQADDIKKGWTDFYWTPWKKYLAANAKGK